MKKLTLIITILLFSFVSISQKYAYIDSKYILEKIPEYAEAQKQLNDLAKKWQKEIEDKYAEIDKKIQEFQAEQLLLPDEMKKQRQAEIAKLQKEAKKYQQDKFGVEGELFKKRQELIEPIQNKIYSAVKELATTGNYSFVFDKANQSNILYADPKYNKSDRVLKIMGYDK